MKHYVKRFLLIFSITLLIGLLLFGVLLCGAVFGYWGNVDDLDLESLTLRQNSSIVYIDPDSGEEKELQSLNQKENRVWVDLKDTPENLRYAFVSIEDERFYEHRGFDLKRTATVIYTDIATDGMLNGPNLSAMQTMAEHVKMHVVASGGVTTLSDLQNLKKTGVEGAIVGKALYTGNLSLPEAVAACR